MKNIQTLVDAVKSHARAHYNHNGWDIVVETYSDNDISNILLRDNVRTEAMAIRVMSDEITPLAEYRDDIRAEGYDVPMTQAERDEFCPPLTQEEWKAQIADEEYLRMVQDWEDIQNGL